MSDKMTRSNWTRWLVIHDEGMKSECVAQLSKDGREAVVKTK